MSRLAKRRHQYLHLLLLVTALTSVAAEPPEVEARHQQLLPSLTLEEQQLLRQQLRDYRLLANCPGNFSGQSTNERVIGVWLPSPSGASVKRYALWRKDGSLQLHDIDAELEATRRLDNVYPYPWLFDPHAPEDERYADTLCGVDDQFDDQSDTDYLTYLLGDRPLFDRQKAAADGQVVCWSTDDVYNNWDCILFDRQQQRFRLWFQQAHAD